MIRQTLFIGLGGCGSKMLNELININSSINGVFVNSNENEIKKLDNFNLESGNYLIINGCGTARSREKSKESLQMDKDKVNEFVIDKIGRYNTYVLIFSMDGGFGAGSFEIFSKAIKGLNRRLGNSEVAVNIIAIAPKVKSRKINLKNTLESYNAIIELSKKGFINSYQFIDNNKMKKTNEFNTEVMEEVNMEYTIANAELDSNDSRAINNSNGYKVILNLKHDIDKINDAVLYAIGSSNFITPSNMGRATHIGISFLEDGEYDVFEALDQFNVTDFDKEDTNDYNNIILLGGLEAPIQAIKLYEDEYNRLENEIIDVEYEQINIKNTKKPNNFDKNKVNNEEKVVKNTKKLSKKQLRDMIDDIW